MQPAALQYGNQGWRSCTETNCLKTHQCVKGTMYVLQVHVQQHAIEMVLLTFLQSTRLKVRWDSGSPQQLASQSAFVSVDVFSSTVVSGASNVFSCRD